MKGKTIWTILTVALLLGFALGAGGAVSFAGEEPEPEAELVGLLITPDYLDLFDMEAWLRDNGAGVASGTVMGDSGPWERKLYAQYQDDKLIFPGVEGVVMAYINWNGTGIMLADNPIEVDHLEHMENDDGLTIQCPATIHVPAGMKEMRLYVNPIFQRGEEIYAETGNSYGSDFTEPGARIGASYKEEATRTENGQSKKRTIELSVNMESINLPQSLVLQQFDRDGALLSADSFQSGELPESIRPEKDAAFLCLVEETESGEARRSFYTSEDNLIKTYECAGSYCIARYAEILW